MVLWQELGPHTISPGPYTLDLDGRRYASAESGQARFTSTGTTGVAPSGLMAYHDYESGDRRLSFENFGSGWEAARGEVLHHTDYRIYPSTTRGM